MNKDVSILIVEDEIIIGEHIARILRKEGFVNLRNALSYSEALVMIEESKPELVLTDIDLGQQKNGIDLAQILSSDLHIPFIFITSHSSINLVRKALKTQPNAYLVKPFKKEDLIVAVEIALFNTKPAPNQEDVELIIKDGSETFCVPFDDILMLKAEANYTAIHTTQQRPKLVRRFLSEVLNLLPAEKFVQVHRSYIVNRASISKTQSGYVVLKDFQVPVGRAYKYNI